MGDDTIEGTGWWNKATVIFGSVTGFIPSTVFIFRKMLECMFKINPVG